MAEYIVSENGLILKISNELPLGAFAYDVPFIRYLIEIDEQMEHTADAMLPTTHTQRILQLLAQKGVLRPNDLDVIGVPRVVLTRMVSAGQLEKVGRGLYRHPDTQLSEHENLIAVATKVPQAVFCLLTALQYHELTTQLPRQTWIAMPRGSHAPKIDYPPIKLVQYSGAAYTEGSEMTEHDGVKLQVYQ